MTIETFRPNPARPHGDTLGLEVVVVRRVAHGLLGLAGELLRGVLGLVDDAHDVLLRMRKHRLSADAAYGVSHTLRVRRPGRLAT